MQGKVQQVVFDYELIEHIRRQDNGGGHRDANARKAAGGTALAQKGAEKGGAASFPTEGTGADPQKTRFRRLERVGLEVADQDLALFAAILMNRLDQIAPQLFGGGAWPPTQTRFVPPASARSGCSARERRCFPPEPFAIASPAQSSLSLVRLHSHPADETRSPQTRIARSVSSTGPSPAR